MDIFPLAPYSLNVNMSNILNLLYFIYSLVKELWTFISYSSSQSPVFNLLALHVNALHYTFYAMYILYLSFSFCFCLYIV